MNNFTLQEVYVSLVVLVLCFTLFKVVISSHTFKFIQNEIEIKKCLP